MPPLSQSGLLHLRMEEHSLHSQFVASLPFSGIRYFFLESQDFILLLPCVKSDVTWARDVVKSYEMK